jgi:3-oxoacyl-(acyl-carrier-protein) synthase
MYGVDQMIYLTDYRLICNDTAELLENLLYPQRVHRIPELWKGVKLGVAYVPHRLADRVLDPALLKRLREREAKTAFILAAGNTQFAGACANLDPDNELDYEYKMLPLSLNQVYAGRIAQMCGANDLVMTDASACASSLKVMNDVMYLIDHKGFDRVIVLGVEDTINKKVLQFFGESKACNTQEVDFTGKKPSAFDKVNGGFYVGQGAVFAVFESGRIAKSAHARLLGAGMASEVSTNAIGQREDGQGFVKAAAQAFRSTQLNPIDIGVVKTHGTGTTSNNVSEKAALYSLFNTPFQATSYKQHIGHTMGASGLLETCMMIDDLKKGLIRGIANRTNHDEFFLSQDNTCARKEQKILSLAAGMGNIYAAAIFDTSV